MTIDPETLKRTQATSVAWAEAIYRGLEDWAHNRPISERVTGIQAPTFRRPRPLSGGDPDGCCLAVLPADSPSIDSLEELIQAMQNLASYLNLIRNNLR